MNTETFTAQSHSSPPMPAKRGCLYSFKRSLLVVVVLLIALPATGFAYETIMAAGDAERYPAPGQLVLVDGHTMHILCRGSGSPTVILESGAGGFSMMWSQELIMQISQTTRVCTYDRAGYGWSEPRSEGRSAGQIAHELHGLLSAAQVEPPYVLAGASNGGLYSRSYAAEYPDEVAGLVLIDATFEGTLESIQALPSTIFVAMGRMGIFRLFPEMICPGTACQEAVKPMIAAFRGRASLYATVDAEWQGLQATDTLATLRERISAAGILGETPLVILSANQLGLPEDELPPDYRAYIVRYRDAMTSLSSNHRFVLVMGGHGIDVEHPELVVQSINDVIDSTRTGNALAEA